MTDVTNTETATGFDALKGLSASAENDAPGLCPEAGRPGPRLFDR